MAWIAPHVCWRLHYSSAKRGGRAVQHGWGWPRIGALADFRVGKWRQKRAPQEPNIHSHALTCKTCSQASVYNEKLLKSDSGSMHAANVQLYFFGVVLNGVGALTQDATVPLLFGMDKPLTWFVCFNLANIGLFVAAIMKYHDTLTKIGAGAVANILVFVVSVAMGDQSFSVPFVVGAAICLTGVGVYQNEQKR